MVRLLFEIAATGLMRDYLLGIGYYSRPPPLPVTLGSCHYWNTFCDEATIQECQRLLFKGTTIIMHVQNERTNSCLAEATIQEHYHIKMH